MMLEAGAITAVKAWSMVEQTAQLDDSGAVAVEQTVLPEAAGQTAGEFRTCLARAVARLDARDSAARHTAAIQERTVVHSPRPDGMSSIWALLPADGAAALMAALTARTDNPAAADDRTADQRRADALVDLAHLGLTGTGLTGTGGGAGGGAGGDPARQQTSRRGHRGPLDVARPG